MESAETTPHPTPHPGALRPQVEAVVAAAGFSPVLRLHPFRTKAPFEEVAAFARLYAPHHKSFHPKEPIFAVEGQKPP